MITKRFLHCGMEYTIEQVSAVEFDVRDVAGCRPLAIRDEGPFETESDAVEAITRKDCVQLSA